MKIYKTFFLLISVLIFTINTGKCEDPYSILNRYLENNCFDNHYNQLIWNSANLFLSNTKLENKLLINQKPDSNYVNIYVLSKDPEDRFKRCNCSYLGKGNIIICDRLLFDSFTNLIASSSDTQLNANFEVFLFKWIFGHEIGHLVYKHNVGSLYFTSTETNTDSSSKYTFDKENQADSYFISKINKNKDQLESFYSWLGLSNLISHLYPGETLGAWAKRDTTSIYLNSNLLYHPPWLYRFLKMANLLLENKVTIDESGYFPFLQKKLKLRNIEITPSELCSDEYFDKKGLDQGSKEENISESDIQFVYQKAIDLYTATLYKLAIKEVNKIIKLQKNKLNNENMPVFYLRATYYYLLKDYNSAIIDLERIEKIRKDLPILYNFLGQVYFSLNSNSDKAKKAWEQAIALNKEDFNSLACLAIIDFKNRDYKAYNSKRKKIVDFYPEYFIYNKLKYSDFWCDKLLSFLE